MQIANARLKLGEHGDIPLFGITPPEAVILNEAHETNAKGLAVKEIVLVGEDQRSVAEEMNRLKERYINLKDKKGNQIVEKMYPGKAPNLPQSFKEAGLAAESAAAKMDPKPGAVPPAAPTEKPLAQPTAPIAAK